MSGSLAIYQGWVCTSVRFRRARGFEASLSQVEIHVRGYPGSFRLDHSEEPARVEPGQWIGRLTAGRTIGDGDQLPQPGVLRVAGELLLVEVDPEGNVYQLPPQLLYVVRIESARRSNTGAVTRLRLTLADVRYRWDRGNCSRWSWNRLRADGTQAQDSLKDGQPYTRRQIVEGVASDLHGAPEVGITPGGWSNAAGPFNLPPYAAALEGLGAIVRGWRTEAPCLDWSGKVSLWTSGQGRVGYAADGQALNSSDLPAHLVLDKRGTGKGYTIEPGHPPAAAVVVAGPKIATVALDDWQFVLHIGGQVLPLTDETVRELTGGKFGIAWLRVWVLAPSTHLDVPGLDPKLAQQLHQQAWRLVRLPGLVVDVDGAEEPGPNAHLLPLMERAETFGGRRMPITVETYSFARINHEMRGEGAEQEAARVARAKLREIRAQIKSTATQTGGKDPFTDREVRVALPGEDLGPSALFNLLSQSSDGLFSGEEMAQALASAQQIERIGRMTDPGFAQQYEAALKQLYGAEGNGRDVLLDLAKDVLGLEKQLQERRTKASGLLTAPLGALGVGENPETVAEELEESRGLVEALKASAQQKLSAIRKQRDEDRLRSRLTTDPAGGSGPPSAPAGKPRGAILYRNLPRTIDSPAAVYDPDLGIVRTSRLAGWLKDPGVPWAHATTFEPRAVKVTFGAVLRPKLSRPLTQVPSSGIPGGGDSYAPDALSDDESHYASWWVPAGPAAVRQTGVTPELRRQAVTLRHMELGAELVPLPPAAGNRAQLDLAAEQFAADALLRPQAVEEHRLTVARPWPVNCDGVVAAVEIVSRSGAGGGMSGFETTIHTGSSAPRIDAGGTRVRPRIAPSGGTPDSASREGNK